ncbi:hypothetical protein DPMN_099995 [Dreissena polymorpha]|uniref:Uncharacterized protein n=1 Tax=Dreissena polymorpha TaxID=45954 RepID=A0A9D4LGN9_DREPO|nr:hypothetical protein DPMN_099995 [Dreissena polymorpha]
MAGRAKLQFYVLVPLLLREAKLVAIQLQLVSEDALTRYRANNYKALDGKILQCWNKYDARDMKTSDFLKIIGNIYGDNVWI